MYPYLHFKVNLILYDGRIDTPQQEKCGSVNQCPVYGYANLRRNIVNFIYIRNRRVRPVCKNECPVRNDISHVMNFKYIALRGRESYVLRIVREP